MSSSKPEWETKTKIENRKNWIENQEKPKEIKSEPGDRVGSGPSARCGASWVGASQTRCNKRCVGFALLNACEVTAAGYRRRQGWEAKDDDY
jgi:hypothetical protein